MIKNAPQCCHKKYNNPNEVFADKTISQTNKTLAIICAIMNSNMDLASVKDYYKAFLINELQNIEKYYVRMI